MSGATDAGAAVDETHVQYYENDDLVTAPSGSLHDEAGQAASGAADGAARGGDDLSEYETGPAQVDASQEEVQAPDSGSSADDLDTDEQAPALRVTFHDQDFVAFPVAHVDGTPAFDLPDGSLRTAPELQMSESVFWEPLESLFVALRVREALGEFLDDDTALVLTFPMLELVVQEDDMYGREVSLHDVLRLHLGLGHKTTMHIKVTEGPRFISRYNHLAMLINAAADEEDEEDEAAAMMNDEDAPEAAEQEGDQAEDEEDEDGEEVGPDSGPATGVAAEEDAGKDVDAGDAPAGKGDEADQVDDGIEASAEEVPGGSDAESGEASEAGAEEVDDDEPGKADADEVDEDETFEADAGDASVDDEEIDSNEADGDEAEAEQVDGDEADAGEVDSDDADAGAEEAEADEAEAGEAAADKADAGEAEKNETDAGEADADADAVSYTNTRNAAGNDTIDAGAVDADEADAGAADTARQKDTTDAAQPENAAVQDDTHNAAFTGEDDHLPTVDYDEQDVGEYEAEDTAPPTGPSDSSSTALPHGKRGAEPDAPGLNGQGDAKRARA